MRSTTVSKAPRVGTSPRCARLTLRRLLLALLVAASLALTLVACSFTVSDAAIQALLDRGRAEYKAGHYSAAEREFREAARLQPKNPEAHYQLGISLREQGRQDEAMTELYRAHLLHRDYSDSLVLLAQLMVRSNDLQNVRWSGDYAERILKKKNEPAMRAEALYILGLGRLRLDDPQGANKYFLRALEEDPNHVGALCLLALQEADRGQVDAGEQRLKAALERDPKSIVLTSALAEFCRMARKPSEAEVHWRQVLVLDPSNQSARVNLVDLLCSLGRDQEAEQIARSLAQLPDSPYKRWPALLLLRRGQTSDALAQLKELLRQSPQDQTARVRVVAALIALNKLSEAEGLIDEAERTGARSLDYLMMRAQIALDRQNAKAASDLDVQAMQFDPASGRPHLLAAQLAESAGTPFRIDYELGEALRLESTLLAARLAVVRRQLAKGDFATALAPFDSCPMNQRSSYPVLLQESWLQLARGDWSQAGTRIDGLVALERSSEITAQRAILNVGLRNFPAARTDTVELTRISVGSPITAVVSQLAGNRVPSAEEVRVVAAKLGSQPVWESYSSDFLVLPRGLLRTALDPERLVTLQSFGRWEPMINAS
jgi:Tfp pilus assembly protein PilF